jgi:hypothetical protein
VLVIWDFNALAGKQLLEGESVRANFDVTLDSWGVSLTNWNISRTIGSNYVVK